MTTDTTSTRKWGTVGKSTGSSRASQRPQDTPIASRGKTSQRLQTPQVPQSNSRTPFSGRNGASHRNLDQPPVQSLLATAGKMRSGSSRRQCSFELNPILIYPPPASERQFSDFHNSFDKPISPVKKRPEKGKARADVGAVSPTKNNQFSSQNFPPSIKRHPSPSFEIVEDEILTFEEDSSQSPFVEEESDAPLIEPEGWRLDQRTEVSTYCPRFQILRVLKKDYTALYCHVQPCYDWLFRSHAATFAFCVLR